MAKKPTPLSIFSPQVRNIISYLLLIIIFILCAYIYLKVHDGSMSCMANPISYGINNMKTPNDAPVTCSCSYPGSQSVLVYDKDNFSVISLQGGGTNLWVK